MLRETLVLVLVAALAGCAGGGTRRSAAGNANSFNGRSNGTPTADAPAEAMSDTQLAAHAGSAEFPNASPRDSFRVAAIVTRDRKVVKLYNFDRNPIGAVNVWINGAYVQPLRAIPANSKALIRTDKVFNKSGDRFSQRGEEVNRVQLETQDGLYSVMGPATE